MIGNFKKFIRTLIRGAPEPTDSESEGDAPDTPAPGSWLEARKIQGLGRKRRTLQTRCVRLVYGIGVRALETLTEPSFYLLGLLGLFSLYANVCGLQAVLGWGLLRAVAAAGLLQVLIFAFAGAFVARHPGRGWLQRAVLGGFFGLSVAFSVFASSGYWIDWLGVDTEHTRRQIEASLEHFQKSAAAIDQETETFAHRASMLADYSESKRQEEIDRGGSCDGDVPRKNPGPKSRRRRIEAETFGELETKTRALNEQMGRQFETFQKKLDRKTANLAATTPGELEAMMDAYRQKTHEAFRSYWVETQHAIDQNLERGALPSVDPRTNRRVEVECRDAELVDRLRRLDRLGANIESQLDELTIPDLFDYKAADARYKRAGDLFARAFGFADGPEASQPLRPRERWALILGMLVESLAFLVVFYRNRNGGLHNARLLPRLAVDGLDDSPEHVVAPLPWSFDKQLLVPEDDRFLRHHWRELDGVRRIAPGGHEFEACRHIINRSIKGKLAPSLIWVVNGSELDRILPYLDYAVRLDEDGTDGELADKTLWARAEGNRNGRSRAPDPRRHWNSVALPAARDNSRHQEESS